LDAYVENQDHLIVDLREENAALLTEIADLKSE
jgi:hypothetical protein